MARLTVDEILGNLREKGIVPKEYVISTPSGFRIEAVGDDDHRRAMEAVKALGPALRAAPAQAPVAAAAPAPRS